MFRLNKVELIGNLGKDPESRFTQGGTQIANFTLATSETWKDKQGVKQEKTEWHRCEAFGQPAEYLCKYAKKGSGVFVEGSITYDEWTDKEGNKRNTTKIKVHKAQIDKRSGGKAEESNDQGEEAPF